MDYNVDGWQWVMENDSWVLYQATPDGTTYGAGIPQSVFDADPESFGNRVAIYTVPTARDTAAIERVEQQLGTMPEETLDSFEPNKWQSLTHAQRVEAIQSMLVAIANATGLNHRVINLQVGHDSSAEYGGSWTPNIGQLFINTNNPNYRNPQHVLRVLAHEMRHAVQQDPSLEIGGGDRYRELIDWNITRGNYRPSDDRVTGFTRYSAQLLERDADAFGNAVADLVERELY
jgi:hypothetical protein